MVGNHVLTQGLILCAYKRPQSVVEPYEGIRTGKREKRKRKVRG